MTFGNPFDYNTYIYYDMPYSEIRFKSVQFSTPADRFEIIYQTEHNCDWFKHIYSQKIISDIHSKYTILQSE